MGGRTGRASWSGGSSKPDGALHNAGRLGGGWGKIGKIFALW